MGMASSQARLLSLTARMHDIEYKAQNIMNQKLQLATQKDGLYQEYCDALDATKIQVAFYGESGNKSFVDATFANVCKYNEDRVKQYALHDSKTGKVVVDDEVYKTYTNGFDNDKYSFAWAMLGMGYMGAWGDGSDSCTFVGRKNIYDKEFLTMTEVEQAIYDKYCESDSLLKGSHEDMEKITNDENSTLAEKQNALKDFRDTLYRLYSKDIYNYMCLNKQNDKNDSIANEDYSKDFDKDDFPKDEFEFYVHLFEEIENSGGCIAISQLDGGNENDNEWFNNMVNSGRVIISVFDEKGANKGWKETSVATSTNENYLKEAKDDKDLKKAEAKYEYELGVINKKETKFDQDLKNLETEETSLKTEIDSIKQVKNDNIERTFGIFS